MHTLGYSACRCAGIFKAAGRRTSVWFVLVSLASAALAGCNDQASDLPSISGDSQRGMALIQRNGCGSCHVIPGIEDANGLVGPPLTSMGRRIYIAGVKRNTPAGHDRLAQGSAGRRAG
jgi:hypothetical protein